MSDKIIAAGIPNAIGNELIYYLYSHASAIIGGSPNGFINDGTLYINPRGYTGTIFASFAYPVA